MPLVGFLGGETPELRAGDLRALRQGLSEHGYVEGRNFAFEFRWAEGRSDRLPALAADLVRRKSSPPALAAKVSSLNRSGGNLTGATSLNIEIGAKRLELLHEMVPTARIVGLLINPANPNGDALMREVQGAARSLGLQLYVLNASTERDFDPAFATLTHVQAGGLVIATDGLFLAHGEQLGALVLRHRLPAIFAYHEFAAAGGLMSYRRWSF
jgi:putative ABC transport system substrate-binding protein